MNSFLKYSIVLFTFCSCSTMKETELTRGEFLSLHKAQKKSNVAVANSAKWARDKAFMDSTIKRFYGSDTLFLIERIDEVDKKVETFVWSSNRDSVLNYNNQSGLVKSWIAYRTFKDPLKTITESFDIKLVKSKNSYLGAEYVFTSQISNGKIKTYLFADLAL